MENQFKKYQRKAISELRNYIPGENMEGISISEEDIKNGSPKEGDMIARNPKNHNDQWLVAADYFRENFMDNVLLPIGYTVKIRDNNTDFGNDAGTLKVVSEQLKFEGENAYHLDNDNDTIYLIGDFD